MTKRLLLVIGFAVGLAIATSVPAGAQEDDGYPPSVFFITVSDITVVPGQTISVSGVLSAGTSSISFTFFSQPVSLGSTTPNADGSFDASVTIPADATLGQHTLAATDSSGLSVSAALEVVAADDAGADDEEAGTSTGAGTTGTDGALPRTGDDTSLPLLRIGAVLLAAGGLLVFMTRRQRDAKDEAPVSV